MGAIRFTGLGKRRWALLGSNPSRNTQAVAEAMGQTASVAHDVRPKPSAVIREVHKAGSGFVGVSLLET